MATLTPPAPKSVSYTHLKYPREEAEETVSELRQLIDEGYLDTPDDYSDVKPADSGVVKALSLIHIST